MNTRLETDSMGQMTVPADSLYGASTQRAVLNFPISGRLVPPPVIHAFGLIKWAVTRTHAELGILAQDKAALIEQAALEVAAGKLDAHFVLDIYQTGSGTSTNMNVNEVIANRVCQIAGTPLGSKEPVHPNDHVNLGQSSNDTFPTAMHVAVAQELNRRLLPALEALQASLEKKSVEFWDVAITPVISVSGRVCGTAAFTGCFCGTGTLGTTSTGVQEWFS
ncbi:MAG: lyase family protein [Verrucomicrobiaceae bacterium]